MRSTILLLASLPILLLGCPQESGHRSTAMGSGTDFVNKIPPLPADARTLAVTVGGHGYQPATLEATAKETVVLAFTRTSKDECGQYVKIEGTDTQAELPLNKTVKVPVQMPESGEVTFVCGMNMMHGIVKVVAVAAPAATTPTDGDAPTEGDTPADAPGTVPAGKAG